jgi:2-polyprenyl-3-methyl-5-hydroxy-6-metoxy-1,4-benzoquinol methylase
MEVLDLACGHGRIANRLTQRGARVTGLDATPLFLEQARRDAAARGVEVDYVSGVCGPCLGRSTALSA